MHRPRSILDRILRRRAGAPGRCAIILLLASLSGLLAAHDTPINPDDPAYLRRQYAWFQSLEPSRQAELRKLHTDFQELSPKSQTHYERVMKMYNAWLAGLSEEDRQQVLGAATSTDRLEAVRRLRERDWVKTLPTPYRLEYSTLEGEARKKKVQEWRTEETDRDDEWAIALRSWDQFQPGKAPQIFLHENRVLIDSYVANLKHNLLENEKRALDDARATADETGNFFGYAYEVVRFSETHPTLPGRVGPKDFMSLPNPIRDALAKNDRHFRKRSFEESREMRKSQGRWPEFAVELTKYCQRHKLTLPMPLGDCRKDEMPPEVVQYLDKVLEPQLRKSEMGRVDLTALNKAQGTWPDYPRLIVEFSKKYKLSIPGWTLPGSPQVWDRVRSRKNKPR